MLLLLAETSDAVAELWDAVAVEFTSVPVRRVADVVGASVLKVLLPLCVAVGIVVEDNPELPLEEVMAD